GHVPGPGPRRLEASGDADELDRWSDRRHAVAGKPRIDRGLELREGARHRGRALVEQSEAAVQDGASGVVQPHRRADARRHVEPADYAVAIEPAAEFRRPPRVRLKPILDEERDVGAGDG